MRYCAWSQPWLQPSNGNEFCHREVTQNLDIVLPFQCSMISIIHSWIPYGFASRNCLCRPDPEGVIFNMSHFQQFQQEVVSDKRNQALFIPTKLVSFLQFGLHPNDPPSYAKRMMALQREMKNYPLLFHNLKRYVRKFGTFPVWTRDFKKTCHQKQKSVSSGILPQESSFEDPNKT